MESYDLLWAILPEGLEDYFEVEMFEKTAELFRITLIEKKDLKGLPAEYQGKQIVDSSLHSVTNNDYPIRGRKGEIILKRRSWKFEGVDKWYRREIEISVPGTKLQKEFALFLKGYD
jgi:hypothetical protein